MVWDYLILVLFILGMVGIAFYTKNRSKSVNDFLLAGKKGLNGWMSAFSYGTTYFSAVIFIGYAGKFGWSFGLASMWIGIGNALLGGLLAWFLLAKRTKNMTIRLQARTMPEFFEKRYDSKFLKIISAIIIFVFLIPYAASVYNGLGNLFERIFEIDGTVVVIVLAGITALYLVFGGYFATSLSDFVQGIIMLLGVIVMFCFFFFCSDVNGLEGLKELSQNGFGMFPEYGDKGFLNSPLIMLISLVLLTSLGVYGLPQTVHKYYSVRDKKAINQGMIITTIFAMIIGVVAYFVGGLSHLFFDSAAEFENNTDNIIPIMLQGGVIPRGLLGLIGVLILSASMSTLASVSLSSASVLTIDLYKGAVNTNASDKKVTLLMRIMCLIFIVLSVVIAILNKLFNITAIAYLMSLSWGTLSGCFFGPFVLGLYNKKITKAAAICSVVGGLVFTATFTVLFGFLNYNGVGGFAGVLKAGVALSPLTGVLCMIFSCIITVVVSCFTKKPTDTVIHDAFEKDAENLIV